MRSWNRGRLTQGAGKVPLRKGLQLRFEGGEEVGGRLGQRLQVEGWGVERSCGEGETGRTQGGYTTRAEQGEAGDRGSFLSTSGTWWREMMNK